MPDAVPEGTVVSFQPSYPGPEQVQANQEWYSSEREELTHWKNIATFLARSHARTSERCAKRNVYFTTIIIILSVLLVFASASTDLKALIDFYCKINGKETTIIFSNIIIGSLGAGTVAFSMWQYHSRYEERHLEHRQFQAEYYNLQKKIARILTGPRDPRLLHSINKELNALNKFAPILPSKVRRWTNSEPAKGLLETIIIHEEGLRADLTGPDSRATTPPCPPPASPPSTATP